MPARLASRWHLAKFDLDVGVGAIGRGFKRQPTVVDVLDHVAHDGQTNAMSFHRLVQPRAPFHQQFELVLWDARSVIDNFELALSGAGRPVIPTGLRLKEAATLGFRNAILPPPPGEKPEDSPAEIRLRPSNHISKLVADIASLAPARNPQRERTREEAY